MQVVQAQEDQQLQEDQLQWVEVVLGQVEACLWQKLGLPGQ